MYSLFSQTIEPTLKHWSHREVSYFAPIFYKSLIHYTDNFETVLINLIEDM